MSQQKELNPIWKAAKPFVNGGASGMLSTCIIQPVDMVKVRLQLGDTGGPVSFFKRLLHPKITRSSTRQGHRTKHSI